MNTSKLVKNLLIRAKLRQGDGDEDSGEAVGTGNDARVALLNSIGDNADRERGEEFNDVNDDGSTSAFETPPAALSEEDSEEAAAREAEATELARIQADQAAAEEAVIATPAKIVRKVNGQDMEITDELLVKAQKIAAADQFLAEAKRLRDEQVAGAKAAPVDETVDLASIARAIQMGTEEEAVAALRKLQVKSPSTDDFSHKIDERLSFNAAYSQFCTEFHDVVSDPRLKKMAEEADIDLINKGDTRPYSERFAQIGKEIREWKTGSSAAPVVKVDTQTKVDRKAAAPVAPKAASSKHVSAVEEETEESASDVIAKMAAARGGPQWMNSATR